MGDIRDPAVELQRRCSRRVPTERLRLGRPASARPRTAGAPRRCRPVVADIVVGADGIRSTVRRSLFGEEPLRYGGHRAWRAGTRFDDERIRDRFVEVWGVGGGFGFGPAGTGRVYWYCFEAVPEGAPAPERPRDEFLRRYGAWFDPIPALIESTDPRRDRADVHLRPAASSHLGSRPRDAARRRRPPDEAEHRPGSRASARGCRRARLVRRSEPRPGGRPSGVRAPAGQREGKRRCARISPDRPCCGSPLPTRCAPARCRDEGAPGPATVAQLRGIAEFRL